MAPLAHLLEDTVHTGQVHLMLILSACLSIRSFSSSISNRLIILDRYGGQDRQNIAAASSFLCVLSRFPEQNHNYS